jgi:hypothetical protein
VGSLDLIEAESRFVLCERYTSEAEVKDKTKQQDILRLASWLVAIFLIGSAILFVIPTDGRWWTGPLHGIGEALIVGAVIGVTVETYAKRRLLHEISSDVFVHIFGHALPIELRGRITQMVRVDKIFRSFHVHYRLSRLNDHEVRVEVSMEYEVENLSNHALPHPLALFLEKQDRPDVSEFRCDCEDDEASRFCYSANSGVKVSNKPGEAGVLQVVAKEISLKPNVKYPITARYSLTLPEDGSDICCFGQPTMGVVITVDACPPDLTVDVGSLRKDTVTTPNRWTFPGAFLENETIRVRWRKRPVLQ